MIPPFPLPPPYAPSRTVPCHKHLYLSITILCYACYVRAASGPQRCKHTSTNRCGTLALIAHLVHFNLCPPQRWLRRSSWRTWPAARCRSRSRATPRPCSLLTCALSASCCWTDGRPSRGVVMRHHHGVSEQRRTRRHMLDELSRMLALLLSFVSKGRGMHVAGLDPRA